MGGVVKKVFGGGEKMKPPPAPKPPGMGAAEVEAAAAAERARVAAMQGRASTMLTGGDGVEDEAEIARKKLLGG